MGQHYVLPLPYAPTSDLRAAGAIAAHETGKGSLEGPSLHLIGMGFAATGSQGVRVLQPHPSGMRSMLRLL